jgi:hypothetical protein
MPNSLLAPVFHAPLAINLRFFSMTTRGCGGHGFQAD